MVSRSDCTNSSLCFEPVIKDWIPPQTPQLKDNSFWNKIELNKFYYILGADHRSWDYYQTAVIQTLYDETETFDPSTIDMINAYKFSPFFLGIQCFTDDVNDGCCMASEENGAMCIFRNEDDEIDTYRFAQDEWEDSVLRNSQSGVAADLNGTYKPVPKDDNSVALEYMDFMGCSGSDSAFQCFVWQPDWRQSWNAYGISDGYPRFGTEEKIQVGVIAARSSDAVRMQDLQLQGAITLAAGSIIALTFTMW